MKHLFFSALCLALFSFAQAQEETEEINTDWATGGEANLSFSSTGFGDYYAGGGLDNTTIGSILNVFGNKNYEGGASWDNNFRLDYGLAKVENTNDEEFTKASDVLDFISKYSTPIGDSKVWNYSAAFNLLSQLTNTRTAFDNDNGVFTQLQGVNTDAMGVAGQFGTNQSSFLSPADLTLGLGFDYKPNDNFSAFISPLSGKLRVVNDDLIAQSGVFGNEVIADPITGAITSFENTRREYGASALANFNRNFLENDMLGFTTGLKLFSNYDEDPQNVDVNWNTLTTLNPWKFITLSYSTDLAYDDNKQFTAFANGEALDNGRTSTVDVQFRNVLGIGLTHKFGAAKE
ncbi:MAG: DUF3078 domain-containing protein [Saprospiraceae bacterium]|nr:DUF3078 domain-containing protein [Saprospiraceae bacterium]